MSAMVCPSVASGLSRFLERFLSELPAGIRGELEIKRVLV